MTTYAGLKIDRDLAIQSRRVRFTPRGWQRIAIAIKALRGRPIMAPDATPDNLVITNCVIGNSVRVDELPPIDAGSSFPSTISGEDITFYH